MNEQNMNQKEDKPSERLQELRQWHCEEEKHLKLLEKAAALVKEALAPLTKEVGVFGMITVNMEFSQGRCYDWTHTVLKVTDKCVYDSGEVRVTDDDVPFR
jgi:hypothetical protein